MGFLELGPALARALCSDLTLLPGAEPRPLDGLLLAVPPAMRSAVPPHVAGSPHAAVSTYAAGSPQAADSPQAARPSSGASPAVGMILFNADGSRPEACGNGLRCIARFAREHGDAAHDTFDVDTDAGVRRVEVLRDGPEGEITRARVGMGPIRVVEAGVRIDDLPPLPTGDAGCTLTRVSVGNPHAVLRVEDERTAPVASWGPALERHPRFPGGVNVGFLAERGGRLRLRVWERGVGETQACGTGACAAALVVRVEGRSTWPARVVVAGGELEVGGDPDVDARLTGPVERLGERELSIAAVLGRQGLENAAKST